MSRELQELSVEEFERALLASAQQDSSSLPDVEAAWNRFALLVGGVALGAESLSGVHRMRDSGAVSPEAQPTLGTSPVAATSTGALLAVSGVATSGLAVKWAASGALVGALFTSSLFLLFGPNKPLESTSAATPETQASVAVAGSESGDGTSRVVTGPGHAGAAVTHGGVPGADVNGVAGDSPGSESKNHWAVAETEDDYLKQVVQPAQKRQRLRSASVASVVSETPARDTLLLAAEVRLVDGARRALRAGNPAGTLSWVERYRSDFPSGSLLADIAYLEIKALKALRRDSEVRRRAEQFLVTYPRDPHSSQVTQLLAGQ